MYINQHSYQSKRLRGNDKGFTIIELTIATLAFSVILVVITAGIIQFTNQYYKGITASNTQNTARAISDAIVQDIQFSPAGNSNTETTPGANSGAFCAGGHLYSYQLGKEVATSGIGTNNKVWHALVQDTNPLPSYCASSPAGTEPLNAGEALGGSNNPSTEIEMLSTNMRLAKLSVINTPGTNLYVVTVRVVYGDDDLLKSNTPGGDATSPDAYCAGGAGSQFCATSELVTTVEKRL